MRYGEFLYGEEFYGPEVSGILSVVPGYLELRINFTKPMLDDDELRDIDNYSIEPNESGAVTCEVLDLVAEEAEFPSYVLLICSDVTQGKEYLLTIVPDVIQDYEGGYITTGYNTATYDGVTELPIIQSVVALSAYYVEVIFSKPMTETIDFTDTSHYVFDKGLKTLAVTIVSSSVVNLRTSYQEPSELYTLTFV